MPRFFFLCIVRSGYLAVAAISCILLTALTLQISSITSFSFLPLRTFLLRRGRRHPRLDLFVDLSLKSFIVSYALEKLYAKKLKTELVSVKGITQHSENTNLFTTIIGSPDIVGSDILIFVF
jgi:hypothetical protein